jgi:hypothetical protein
MSFGIRQLWLSTGSGSGMSFTSVCGQAYTAIECRALSNSWVDIGHAVPQVARPCSQQESCRTNRKGHR